MVPASESGGKHQDGGFWRVEVSDEGVDGFELEAWIDENIVFALGFAGFGPELQGTRNGGANGNYAVAGSFGCLNRLNGVGRDLEPFRMHLMLLNIVSANREESAETDVKGEIFDLDALILELFHEFFGHIKAGGWRSGRAEIFGPDSLIALDVFFFGIAMHVWGKGNIAVILGNFLEWASGGCGSGAVAENFFNRNYIVG